MKKFKEFKEDLRNWFDPKHPDGGWKRINSKGEAIGPCAREPGEAKPKCMSNEKRAELTKKERANAVASKRKHDSNPERKGAPINVSNHGKGKISEDIEQLIEKNVPTSPEKWAQAKSQAKAKFDVYPSAYANGWAAKKYKEMGGGWKSVSEAVKDSLDIGEYDQEGDMAKSDLRSIIANAKKMHDMIEDADNLPEWVQSKITKAEDYISTVANYLTAEMSEETELQESGGEVLYKKGNDHIEKYGEDSFALYKNGKKEKFYTSLKDAKQAMNEDWQDVNRKDNTDGMSQKAVNTYKRENPGSNLQTAVTEKNPSGKRASRRKSFCARMSGMKSAHASAETKRDPDSPINKALRRWRC
jgi:chaperonin cofactor prefoldin